jgi:tetratricopeptide (TPR) repeat protein
MGEAHGSETAGGSTAGGSFCGRAGLREAGARFDTRPMRGHRLLRAPWAQVLLIALAVAACYHRTLGVPFTLDDFSSIRDNDLIYRWRGLAALWRFEPNRVVAYLSFALNYRLGRFDPAGYHLVNLLVHALAGIAALGLARGLVRTPRVRDALPALARDGLPPLVALLFVLHPLQTQAVTYVVQRLASLVALFYLAALAAYVQARLAASAAPRAGWSLACALAGALAFFTKENSATLPAAIVLLEAIFFAPGRRRMLATAAGAAVAMVAFWLTVALGHAADPLAAGSIATLSQETPDVTRAGYLATQLVVLVHYLRLFVVPAGLHLDYDLPLRTGFARADVLLAAALHATLLGLALACWRRRPVVAFGVLFYYLAHAVESSVVPIRDLVFEHRTYLPNLGLCLAAAWLLLAELPRTRAGARAALPATAIALLALAVLTWRRNELWRDPVAFWRSNVALAPGKPRAWAMLGRRLVEDGRPQEGLEALERAERLRPARENGVDAEMDDINIIWALRLLGRYDEALARYARARARGASPPMHPALRASLDVNAGGVLFDQGRWSEAESAFREALRLAPNSLPAMANLAGTCAQTGRLAEAESLCVAVLALDPADRVTRVNLWQVRAQVQLGRADDLRREGRTAEALAAYRAALAALETAGRLDPANAAVQGYARQVRQLIESLPSAMN